jgi:uncharacterized protein (TIGR00369 family)
MKRPEFPPLPDNIVEALNESLGGFNQVLGLRFLSATYDEVVAELELGPQHHQPYGLVHGGVYCAIIETLASAAAALTAAQRQQHTVGLENATTFLRACRTGTLRGRATPLARGRRTHVWEVTITSNGQLVASGRVRMLCFDHGTAIAGETVEVKR